MKRKDIEKAFAELDLAEMSPLLEALTDLHKTKKEARVAELEAEIAALRGPRVGNGRRGGGGDVVGNGRVAATKRASPAPKYRSLKDPNLTWAGRGGTPRWMVAEMKETKKPKEAFLIKG